MSRQTVVAVFAVPAFVAGGAIWREKPAAAAVTGLSTRHLIIALIGAALLALAVTAGVLPKFSSDGVTLAAPIFDHSKVAMVDEMVRAGRAAGTIRSSAGPACPRGWPTIISGISAPPNCRVLTDVSGWEADAALTWFTAFASLPMMIGLAFWLSGRASAGLWVVVLAATALAAPAARMDLPARRVQAVAGYQSGFGGWLFQTSWAPQHMAVRHGAVLAVSAVERSWRGGRFAPVRSVRLIMRGGLRKLDLDRRHRASALPR